MPRFYLIIGLLALTTFSWAQYRGLGLFDDTPTARSTRHIPSSHATSHK